MMVGMEKDQSPLFEYQGDSPRWAATKEFFASTAFWTIGFELLWRVIPAVFTKTKPTQVIDDLAQAFKRDWHWQLGLGAMIGSWDAKNAYEKAKSMKSQHDYLVADNIAMRSQLNQTGQILRHVAGEVEKGKLADSQLTMKGDAPPTHVAKLEAQEAAAAAQTALAKF